MMKNLINIKNLTTAEIDEIMALAKKFESGDAKSRCKNANVALLFFENSTRTRFSFEMALHNLNARIFNFDSKNSSITKGESLFDTVENLYAIGIMACVVRSSDTIIEKTLEKDTKMRFINAGEGNFSHPTQALLDFYTMKQKLGDVKGKKVVIVGDILHSRVARSNIELLSRYNADVVCVAPSYFQDKNLNVKYSENLADELKNADITMCLRIQRERIEDKIPFDNYVKNFRVNASNINPETLLMHPGPVNRDVELTSDLIDGKIGETILLQAKNGVYVRMAILDLILGENPYAGGENGKTH